MSGEVILEIEAGQHALRLQAYHDRYEITRGGETLVIVGSQEDGIRRARALAELLTPPDPCPVCCRPMRLVAGGRVAGHNQQPAAPGRRGRHCPGSGLKARGGR